MLNAQNVRFPPIAVISGSVIFAQVNGRAILLGASALLSACAPTGFSPSAQVVDLIETKLRRDACVGALSTWHREYRFRHPFDVPLDTNVIGINLTEAGPQNPPGRFILSTTADYVVDDRPIRVAFGTYNVRKDELKLSFCGHNSEPPTAARVVR